MYRKIRFQGEEYLFIGGENYAALTTAERYSNGVSSYAHLFPNGQIKRYGEVIGTKEEIEFLGEAELPDMTIGGVVNLLSHPSWGGNE